jgi:hypothetical protein
MEIKKREQGNIEKEIFFLKQLGVKDYEIEYIIKLKNRKYSSDF